MLYIQLVFQQFRLVHHIISKEGYLLSFFLYGVPLASLKKHAKRKYNELPIWTAHLHNYRYWKLKSFVFIFFVLDYVFCNIREKPPAMLEAYIMSVTGSYL